MQKEDPLATQVWKLYARTKATLPHAHRMENITWRMMGMALRKPEQHHPDGIAAQVKLEESTSVPKSAPPPPTPPTTDDDTRGRRVDKGKARVIRIEGFHTGQPEDEE